MSLFLFLIYLIILIVATFYGLMYFKKFNKPYRIIVILLLLTLILDLTGRIGMNLGMESTYFIYHFNIIILVSINLLFYLNIFENSSQLLKRIAILVTIIILIGTILNSVFYQQLNDFPSNGITLHAIQTIFLSLLAFQEMIKQPIEIPLLEQPLFWVNSGNLFFYTITFLIFAFFDYYKMIENWNYWFMLILTTSGIVLYSSYFRAIYLDKNRKHDN